MLGLRLDPAEWLLRSRRSQLLENGEASAIEDFHDPVYGVTSVRIEQIQPDGRVLCEVLAISDLELHHLRNDLMPYHQQRFVALTKHDDENWDLYVTWAPYGGTGQHRRFSVIVPRTARREELLRQAILLATFARLETASTSIFVRKDHIYNALKLQLAREQAPIRAERLADAAVRLQARQAPFHPAHNVMAPDAQEVAKELLRQVDPILLEKVENGYAFYFVTATTRYIWYPSQRSIVSLDEDMPHYVCVHSRDHTVEQNTYDWALTMRTYLLGAETHWRQTANFHALYAPRGTYAQAN